MNPYATHIPILNIVKDFTDRNTVFEYGMGEYSTKLFAENFNQVISVEMQEQSWFEKMSQQKPSNVDLLCMIGDKPAVDYFDSLNSSFSLIFVDGHGGNRWECINHAFGHSDIIVTHDTEAPGYKWNLIQLPSNYRWIDVKSFTPWTSVLTTNEKLIEKLRENFQIQERMM